MKQLTKTLKNGRIEVFFDYINTIGMIHIGDSVLMGGNGSLLFGLHFHAFNDPRRSIWDTPADELRMISIGSDAWIGSIAVFGSDIRHRSTIAAGSVGRKSCGQSTH